MLAKEKVTLKGGQTSITLEGQNITLKMPGLLDVKGTSKGFVGPRGEAAELEALPVGTLVEPPAFMELNFHDEWLVPVSGAPYRVVFDDGTVRDGKLDANGYARLEGVPNKSARVYYGEDQRAPEARVEMPPNTFQANSSTNEEAIANIERYAQQVDDFWENEATPEQRDVRVEFNTPEQAEGEDAWLYLDEAQQKSLKAQLGKEQE